MISTYHINIIHRIHNPINVLNYLNSAFAKHPNTIYNYNGSYQIASYNTIQNSSIIYIISITSYSPKWDRIESYHHTICHISVPPITPYIIYPFLPSHRISYICFFHHTCISYIMSSPHTLYYIIFPPNTPCISHIISSIHTIFHILTLISYNFQHSIPTAHFDILSNNITEANIISFIRTHFSSTFYNTSSLHLLSLLHRMTLPRVELYGVASPI